MSIGVGLADEAELIFKIKNCVERLQLYCDKVENQRENWLRMLVILTNVLMIENELMHCIS